MIVIYDIMIIWMKSKCIWKYMVKTSHLGVNHPAIVQEIPHFACISAFLGRPLAFWAFFRETIKFAENLDNFQLHGNILWTEAVRKRMRHIFDT